MMNLRNFGDEPPPRQIEGGGNGGRIPSNLPLTRQPSVYALTFDELQSTMGGMGKDFGSMNMDELLKNIWSADETQQSVPSSSGRPEGGGIVGGGNLQKQGSLTLPRTLSKKTVDEVWKDISGCEYGGRKDEKGNGRPNLQQQRQQTLGEMTLEEFLVRAGVVREDITQFAGKPNPINVLGFPQIDRGSGLMGNRILDSNNQIAMQSLNLPLNNVNGVRSSQQQQQQQQQQLFSQQTTATYTSPGMKGGIVGISDPAMNSNLVPGAGLQQGGGMGVVGLGGGAANVAAASPANQLSPDGIGRSNEETSSVSPAPYMFNGGMRGRKRSGAVEKVVERRQRRMIKNRESAARSRARKQAYTMELEAEVSKLKEENEELRKKQAEMENQKNQVLEMMQSQQGRKKQCLRRTQSGHW